MGLRSQAPIRCQERARDAKAHSRVSYSKYAVSFGKLVVALHLICRSRQAVQLYSLQNSTFVGHLVDWDSAVAVCIAGMGGFHMLPP